MSTETYHVVKFMTYVHMKNAQHIQCVPQGISPIRLKNIYTRNLLDLIFLFVVITTLMFDYVQLYNVEPSSLV